MAKRGRPSTKQTTMKVNKFNKEKESFEQPKEEDEVNVKTESNDVLIDETENLNEKELNFTLDIDSLNSIDFHEIKKRMDNGGVPPGKEPHKLLLYFATTLSKNDKVLLIAHDPSFREIYNQYTNVTYTREVNINELDNCNDYEQIIIDVDPHDGKFEKEVYDKCKEMNFKGIIIYDDTKLNDNMKSFWNSIPEKNKVDVTKYGHWSGTGVVFFNKNVNFELK